VLDEIYQGLVEFPLDVVRGVDIQVALLRQKRLRGLGIALLILGIFLVILS
jgi:hypothetical protein